MGLSWALDTRAPICDQIELDAARERDSLAGLSADTTEEELRAEQAALRAEMDRFIGICNFYAERRQV